MTIASLGLALKSIRYTLLLLAAMCCLLWIVPMEAWDAMRRGEK